MGYRTALEAIDGILKITGWKPERNAIEYLVALDNGVLRFHSPDGSCLIIRENLNELPSGEMEQASVCRDLSKLNAGLARTSDCRVVLEGQQILLEEVLTSSQFGEVQIAEVFEDFLNCFDFIKTKVDNSINIQSTQSFNALQFLL